MPGEPVLRGISFRMAAGERIALVGPTGHGKTSIVSALCRFYEVDRGRILVDGLDIREWDKTALRRHVGLVLQDVFLFSGTVGENIGLASPELTEDALWDMHSSEAIALHLKDTAADRLAAVEIRSLRSRAANGHRRGH